MSFVQKIKAIPGQIAFFTPRLLQFLSSGIFLRNFLWLVVVSILFITMLFWWLSIYTRHGETVSVPEIVNLNIETAQELMSQSSLEIFVMDSVYKTGAEPNLILSQEPAPGEKVKEGRKIYVTVTAYNAPLKKLNYKLAGADIKFVREQLKRMNMIVEERPISGGVDIGLVTRIIVNDQTIFDKNKKPEKNYFEVPEQTKVVVEYIFSEGAEMPIPDMLGKSVEAAKFELNVNKLNYTIIADESVSDTSDVEAYIWKTEPMPDPYDQIRKGETVILFITKVREVLTPDFGPPPPGWEENQPDGGDSPPEGQTPD